MIRLIFNQVINLYLIYFKQGCIFLRNLGHEDTYCILVVDHTYRQAQKKIYQLHPVKFTY